MEVKKKSKSHVDPCHAAGSFMRLTSFVTDGWDLLSCLKTFRWVAPSYAIFLLKANLNVPHYNLRQSFFFVPRQYIPFLTESVTPRYVFHRHFQNFPLSDTSFLWNRMSVQSVSFFSCSPPASLEDALMCATPRTSEQFICAVNCTSLLSWLFLPDLINHINRLTRGVGTVYVVGPERFVRLLPGWSYEPRMRSCCSML